MRRAASILGLAALLAGVPIVLLVVSGPPHLPSYAGISLSDDYLDPEIVLDTLALITWIACGYLGLAVLLRLVAVTACPPNSRSRRVMLTVGYALSPSPLRHLIDFAVGGSLLAASLSASPAVAGHTRPAVIASAVAPTQIEPEVTDAAAAPSRSRTYVVGEGDSLWRIAEEELGSGSRWREIYDLNRDRAFSDGRSLQNPRLILPGWRLRIPAGDGETVKRRVAAASVVSRRPAARDNPRSRPAVAPADLASRPTLAPTPTPRVDVEHADEPAPAVQLPSGATVALSFASGLLTAEIMGRLRRRRRYRPLEDPSSDLTPEPRPSFTDDLRRAGAATGSARLREALHAVTEGWKANGDVSPGILAVVEYADRVEIVLAENGSMPGDSGGAVSPMMRYRRHGALLIAEVRGPFRGKVDSATREEMVLLAPIGYGRDASVTQVALLGTCGLSVEGDAAPDAIRHIVLTLAAPTDPEDLHIVLLGAEDPALEALPHVIAACQWADAAPTLARVQAEFLRRARLLFEAGADDARTYIEGAPDEAFPTILVVAGSPPPALSGAVDALGREAPGVGGALVAKGWRFSGATTHLRTEDQISVETDLPIARTLRGFSLPEAALQQTIATISEAWSEPEVVRVPDEHDRDPEAPADAAPEVPTPLPVAQVHVDPGVAGSDPPPPGSRLELLRPLPPAGVAAVYCLGSFRVERGGRLVQKGWRARAREMLAYLIAYPDGVPKERLIELLWPEEEDLARASREFDRAVHFIRRDARGPDDTQRYVDKTIDSWRLVAEQWWIDAWEMLRLVEDAQRETDPLLRAELLTAAVAHYHGEFCDDCYFAWTDEVRERYRKTFLHACALLAELLVDAGDLRKALDVLDLALAQDPLCEELARLAIRVEASAGRRYAAERRYERLKETLRRELGVDPDPDTHAIMRQVQRAPSRATSAAANSVSVDPVKMPATR